MKIESIFSARKALLEPNNDLVYEWEDIFAEKLNVPLVYDTCFRNNRWTKHLPFQLNFLTPEKPTLSIEMVTYRHNGLNKSNIVPWIVDFYLRSSEQLAGFYKCFSKNPIVLISSKEIYDFLLENKCPLKIAHLPLSLPDRYGIQCQELGEKPFDVVLLGRQNPVLMNWFEKYVESHPKLTYLTRRKIKGEGNWSYYDSYGNDFGKLSSREEYMNAIKKGKVSFYSTQGVDVGLKRSNGFNQVTPRFLELLSAGCNVLGRFCDNPDTRYYELEKFCPNINSYEMFEKKMDKALSEPADIGKYKDYLKNHYTSARVCQFLSIIEQI